MPRDTARSWATSVASPVISTRAACWRPAAEHGELSRIPGHRDDRSGAALLVLSTRRRQDNGGRNLLRHSAWPDACPQCVGQCRGDGPRLPAVLATAEVLHVDEELDGVHRPVEGSEKQWWSSAHGRDELIPRHAVPRRAPHLLGVAGHRRPDQAGPAVGAPLPHDDVRRQDPPRSNRRTASERRDRIREADH